ncbi:molybdate ABC transporter substrate-binding protein [Roseovarius faecimaris]|uniref:Molybdate ABC transporter substrate-binding protein n=1 Tax=Roseovarius faecimaris TaxID=2494550 RepID=A0A6I6INX2_9RHOB|nr:molybdate ABC transporter substrate-binding protein [Roseovarius faecimaris]
MRHLFRNIAAVCALFFMSVSSSGSERVTVFAAASLKGALDEVAEMAPVEMTLSYGGSGLIARQVAQGAPADLVILANTDWMDWLVSEMPDRDLLPKNFLGNSLVLIGARDADEVTALSGKEIHRRLAGGRLAVGLTTSVPAGIYARQWLETEGIWTSLRPHLAEVDNVRAALALVARGEAPLGVVYASDALAEPRVRVLYNIPASAHEEITYPLLVLDGKNASQASVLQDYLMSEATQAVFVRHGFLPVRPRP